MKYLTVGYRLPSFVSARLFGDRRRYGVVPQVDDPCWREWQKVSLTFYNTTQKRSVGKLVNDAGYRILRTVELEGKSVLEIGPGDIQHIYQWRGRPARYVIADVADEMLDRSAARLATQQVSAERALLAREGVSALPFASETFDVVLSFYSLEHLHPLHAAVSEVCRVLRPGGLLVGAIPTEGGLGWGLGRFLTSRRWLHKHTAINPEKIICWEHPNFAEHILDGLDQVMKRNELRFWPWRLRSIDLNLVVSFVYQNCRPEEPLRS